jgi:2-polyprenyl-6-methoxyphenol hydroxylase-like FAD-dependent oxidoreductase
MNEHGVIIGGGISGLLAGHVLADRFERVTVLERDHYPIRTRSSAPPTRRGAPQSRCLHLLTAAGAAAFEKLMPGWSNEIIVLGGIPFDVSADAALRVFEGWLPRTPSGVVTYACSRSLIEEVLRYGLARKSNVRIEQGQKVVGFLSRPSGQGVAGVRVANQQCAGEIMLFADFVIDASGAGSALAHWIDQLLNDDGSPVPRTVIDTGLTYVSRWFHLNQKDAPDWCCLSVARTKEAPSRAAIMLRAEEDRWGVALLAVEGTTLPSDHAGFLDFTADGELHGVLSRATPVSPIHRYGRCSNRMIHYDRLTVWPEGLVAIGDSVCALDPYFGLGMTAAARGALLLAMHLDQNGREMASAQEFQKELASLNVAPWQIATLRDPDGRPLASDRTLLRHLYEAAPASSKITHALLAVQHMLLPMDALMQVELA